MDFPSNQGNKNEKRVEKAQEYTQNDDAMMMQLKVETK
jgi:hypothetical protein